MKLCYMYFKLFGAIFFSLLGWQSNIFCNFNYFRNIFKFWYGIFFGYCFFFKYYLQKCYFWNIFYQKFLFKNIFAKNILSENFWQIFLLWKYFWLTPAYCPPFVALLNPPLLSPSSGIFEVKCDRRNETKRTYGPDGAMIVPFIITDLKVRLLWAWLGLFHHIQKSM